jgi:hypothetical protein
MAAGAGIGTVYLTEIMTNRRGLLPMAIRFGAMIMGWHIETADYPQ